MATRSEVMRHWWLGLAFTAACIVWASGFCPASTEAWSPDGTKLLYSYRFDNDTHALALHDRTSGETRTVRRFPKAVMVKWVGWRPDGKTAVLITAGKIRQLDPVTWDTVRTVVVDDPISEPVIVGRYLFFIAGAKKRKLARLELETDALLQQQFIVSHIFGDGDHLYYVLSPSKQYGTANHTFGRIDLDTLERNPEFTLPAHSYPKLRHPTARGGRIAFVSTVDDEWRLHVFEGDEPARSIPISDETAFAIRVEWGADDRLCVFSATMNPTEPEPAKPAGELDLETEVEFITSICEFDLESDSITCNKMPSVSVSMHRYLVNLLSNLAPGSPFYSTLHDIDWRPDNTKSCLELLEDYEVEDPPRSFALPADYAQLGQGVVVSGYEAGSEMFDLTDVRNRLSKYLRKRHIALANDTREFPPLIAGDLRLPLMLEEIEMADGNLLLHLTIGSGFFTDTLTLECFDPAGNSMWVEKIEVGGLFSGPWNTSRALWKRMKEKLASHLDELRREVASTNS